MARIGITSNASLDELFNSIELGWNTYNWKQDAALQKIALFNTNAKGDRVVYPWTNLSSAPTELLLGADRQFAGLEIFETIVQHKQYVPEKSMEVYDYQLKSDIYNVIGLRNDANKIIMGARNLYKRVLADLINTNGNAFDSLSFFNAAHPANQYSNTALTYANDFTGVDLDEAGLATALQALATIPSFDGQIDSGRVGKVVIVVPTMQLWVKATKLITGGALIPVNGTTVGTSVAASTIFNELPYGIEVVFLPELAQAANPATLKRWYVINGDMGMGSKAFIVSVLEPPTPDYEYEASNMKKLAARFSWHAYMGAGLGMPSEAVRLQTP